MGEEGRAVEEGVVGDLEKGGEGKEVGLGRMTGLRQGTLVPGRMLSGAGSFSTDIHTEST